MASGDHLDLIDSLRSVGLSRYIDLPEIIVCGDQSAGKSSVLEAISRWPFPTRDGVCTRFATELALRRGDEESAKASIIAGKDRSAEDKARLESWRPEGPITKDGLGQVTEEAERAMSGQPGTRAFYDDILRIELTGPQQPHLTMIDLPGIFRAGNNEQSDRFAEPVKKMITDYMARPRSIILTVVSAKVESTLQEITNMAKEADPKGIRTLGLITKPDTLDVGSDTERRFITMAQNEEKALHFRFGWHVLKNRSFAEQHVDSDQRDAIEREFFSRGLWHSVDPSWCGAAALNTRLSRLLKEQIILELPSLLREMEAGIDDCAEKLRRLGPVRSTPSQQLTYLMHVSEKYTSLVTQAVDGTYTHSFFGSRHNLEGFPTRLRAVVQNELGNFGDKMRSDGQSEYIIDSDTDEEEEDAEYDPEEDDSDEDDDDHVGQNVPRITREDYIERVAERLKFCRGRELQGLFNPLIVTDLFVEQSRPWRKIAKRLVQDILDAVHRTTQLIIEEVTETDVFERVLGHIREAIERLAVGMEDKVEELLVSSSQHPITYNPQLTETVQQAQYARNKRAVKNLMRSHLGLDCFDDPDSEVTLNPSKLLRRLEKRFEPNMEQFGSSFAVDYMEAYYKAR